MTTAAAVLNSTLYRRLRRIFGDVQVHNQGEARIVRPDPLTDENKLIVQQYGEQYYICCPFCGNTLHRLAISYMYGQCDEYSGRQLTSLAYCHNRQCFAKNENQRKLAEMLRAEQLEEAPLRPGKRITDNARVVELPSPVTRLDKLPRGHLARRYLDYRGFNPVKLGRCYELYYCDGSDDPLTRNSIIIPVYLRGTLRGWQALPLPRSDSASSNIGMSSKYLSARGMNNTRLLYNLDRARQYESGILVMEPQDVWSFGLMAVSLIGESMSEFQERLFVTAFRRRTAVVLLKKDERRRSASGELVEALKSRMHGRLATVELPPDLPPGSEGRKELRAHVAKEAKAQGIRVCYAKCP